MTAYHVPIDAPDAEIVGLTLNDRAGVQLDERGALREIGKAGQKLDAALIAQLRKNTAGIADRAPAWRLVRVKEFSWTRWSGKWYFVGGGVALLAGAMLARGAREVAAPMDDGSVLPIDAATLAQLVVKIESLTVALRGAPSVGAATICDTCDELQRRWITPLVRGQPGFVAKFGIGRAAETISSLAAVERYLNRAWSAAADGYVEAAVEALGIAEQSAHATREQLARLESGRAT
jgi:hypothetical protein